MAVFLLIILLDTQMDEGRALNIPRMGDVGLSNTGDGVCTGRELPLRMEFTSD